MRIKTSKGKKVTYFAFVYINIQALTLPFILFVF